MSRSAFLGGIESGVKEPSTLALRTEARPEVLLLLCCARTTLDAQCTERIRELVRANINWPLLMEMAGRHKVRPLLYLSLSQACPDTLPEPVSQELRSRYLANAGHNLHLAAELLKLLALLEAHSVRVVPFKGLEIAVTAYRDVSLRDFVDLDLLVGRDDYCRTQELLISHGYKRVAEFSGETALVHRSTGTVVDLHRSLTFRENLPINLEFEHLCKDLIALQVPGGTIPGLKPEHMMLVLCVQVAKDGQSKRCALQKICDIAELLRSHPELDWNQLFEEASDLGCRRIVSLGLVLARDLLDAPMPHEISRRIRHDSSLKYLVHYVYDGLFQSSDPGTSEKRQVLLFSIKAMDRWRDKLYPICHRVMNLLIPNERDRDFLPLPTALSFLYFIVRPIRLIRDSFKGRFTRS